MNMKSRGMSFDTKVILIAGSFALLGIVVQMLDNPTITRWVDIGLLMVVISLFFVWLIRRNIRVK